MPKLKLEDAYRQIKKVVASAEKKFFASYGRLPSLVSEQDYILLAEFLRRDPRDREEERGAITAYDVANILLREFLEREGFFSSLGNRRRCFFDGLMGRVYYCPPPREYRFRIRKLRKLEEETFPSDFPQFLEVAEKVLKASKFHLNHHSSPDQQERYKKLRKLSDWMSNPASSLLALRSLQINNCRALVEWWGSLAKARGVHYL